MTRKWSRKSMVIVLDWTVCRKLGQFYWWIDLNPYLQTANKSVANRPTTYEDILCNKRMALNENQTHSIRYFSLRSLDKILWSTNKSNLANMCIYMTKRWIHGDDGATSIAHNHSQTTGHRTEIGAEGGEEREREVCGEREWGKGRRVHGKCTEKEMKDDIWICSWTNGKQRTMKRYRNYVKMASAGNETEENAESMGRRDNGKCSKSQTTTENVWEKQQQRQRTEYLRKKFRILFGHCLEQ